MPFKPGNNANPKGRPKGSKHKLRSNFIDKLGEDFAQFGAEAIARVREEEPAQYLRVIASLIPKEVQIDETQRVFVIEAPAPMKTDEEWEQKHAPTIQ